MRYTRSACAVTPSVAADQASDTVWVVGADAEPSPPKVGGVTSLPASVVALTSTVLVSRLPAWSRARTTNQYWVLALSLPTESEVAPAPLVATTLVRSTAPLAAPW